MVYGVPPTTHRYRVEPLAGCPQAKTMLSCRYVKFKEMLFHSNNQMVNLLAMLAAEDHRTVMGNTLSKLKNELAGNDLTCNNVKSYMQYIPVPEQEKWRLDFFEELMEADAKTITIENMNAEDITSMIDMLCTT
jgi:hypothetical protein